MSEDKNIKREKIEQIDLRNKIRNIEKEESVSEKKEINFESTGIEKNSVEQNQEQDMESSEHKGTGSIEAEPRGIIASSQVSQQRKTREKEIEKILEKDLEESYVKMSPDLQKAFKAQGEETAMKINELFEKGKVKVTSIIELIKRWLSIIPGVNKYFLEQEAKIKADEIISTNKVEQ